MLNCYNYTFNVIKSKHFIHFRMFEDIFLESSEKEEIYKLCWTLFVYIKCKSSYKLCKYLNDILPVYVGK